MMSTPKFWIGLVIGLLSLNAVIGAALVYFAHSDPSHVIEKDYYAKAMAWDDHREQIARNKSLGWSVEIEPPHFRTPVQRRDVRLRLADEQGEAIEDASIEIVAYHNARSGDRQSVILSPEPNGGYEGEVRINRPGWWQFDVEVHFGGERFTDEQRHFIDAIRK